MAIKDLAQGKLILWGANWSLYTAKVRSYLVPDRKLGISHAQPVSNKRLCLFLRYKHRGSSKLIIF